MTKSIVHSVKIIHVGFPRSVCLQSRIVFVAASCYDRKADRQYNGHTKSILSPMALHVALAGSQEGDPIR